MPDHSWRVGKIPGVIVRSAPAVALPLMILGLLPVLQGCAPTVAAGAAVGVAVVEERGLGGAITDTEIRVRINDLWFQTSEVMLRQVRLQVHNRRVLLSGRVQTPELRDEAVRLAWQTKNVEEVINEIRVGAGNEAVDLLKDSAISAALRIKILSDTQIRSFNYSVEASEGTVYLLGIAQSQDELDRVINHARTVNAVRKVVSHVVVKPG